MIVQLLTEHHLEFLSLKEGCRGSSETTLVKMLEISCRTIFVERHPRTIVPNYFQFHPVSFDEKIFKVFYVYALENLAPPLGDHVFQQINKI